MLLGGFSLRWKAGLTWGVGLSWGSSGKAEGSDNGKAVFVYRMNRSRLNLHMTVLLISILFFVIFLTPRDPGPQGCPGRTPKIDVSSQKPSFKHSHSRD